MRKFKGTPVCGKCCVSDVPDASLTDCLSKINRMDIVHLMETSTEPVQEHTSHSSVEMGPTIALDDSEGERVCARVCVHVCACVWFIQANGPAVILPLEGGWPLVATRFPLLWGADPTARAAPLSPHHPTKARLPGHHLGKRFPCGSLQGTQSVPGTPAVLPLFLGGTSALRVFPSTSVSTARRAASDSSRETLCLRSLLSRPTSLQTHWPSHPPMKMSDSSFHVHTHALLPPASSISLPVIYSKLHVSYKSGLVMGKRPRSQDPRPEHTPCRFLPSFLPEASLLR